MPVVVNKIRQQDIEDLKNRHVSGVITVVNVKKEEYAGIKPGEIGQIDIARWGPYQFALKRIKRGPIPVEEKPAPDISKPYGDIDFLTLLNAFVKAAGGNARAAVMLGTERTNLSHWLLGNYEPESFIRDLCTWDHLMELLSDEEKPLLKQHYTTLLAEKKAKGEPIKSLGPTQSVKQRKPRAKPKAAPKLNKRGRPAKKSVEAKK